jgi:hypothetical protein
LEAATVIVIASDFDLSNDDEVSQARLILESIRESAAEEENTGFDPSGSSGAALYTGTDVDNDSSDHVESCPEFANRSQDADTTGLTPALSSLDLGGPEGSGSDFSGSQNGTYASGLEDLGNEEKEARLKDMFPSLSAYRVTHALKTCTGNIDRAMDVLLNAVFFEEEDLKPQNRSKLAPRGVDGFIAQGNVRRSRRSKARKVRLLGDERRSSSMSGSWDERDNSESLNKWDLARKDIEFVTSRTFLATSKVSSVYHAKNASLAATLHSLTIAEMDTPTPTKIPEEAVQTQITELAQLFPALPTSKLAALLRLSRNSPSAARDLAEVMVQRPNYGDHSLGIQALPQHSPVDFRSEDESEAYSPRPRTTDASVLRAQAMSQGASGSIAFNQASAAYRRGKSQPLMGGAAAYYSQVGREHMKNAKELEAAAAEAHVQANSSSIRLDLHGVSVHHAVRIAKDRVRIWWDGLGDAKYAPGGWSPARDGFVVVTGKGSHSRPGAPQIGPAMLRQLTAEGWKVEAESGYLRVTGISRRR